MKPSDRITELQLQFWNSDKHADPRGAMIVAIVRYLDEQHAERESARVEAMGAEDVWKLLLTTEDILKDAGVALDQPGGRTIEAARVGARIAAYFHQRHNS